MKKKLTIFAAPMLVWLSTAAGAPLNDLSHLTSKQLDINVATHMARTGESGDTKPVAIFYLDHPYTNTLKCEITASVPVVLEGGDERIIKVTIGEELIFPPAAFPDKTLSYDLDLAGNLHEGEVIKLNYSRVQQGAAICSGLGPSYRLPKRTCLALNENHDQFCRDNASTAGGKNGLVPPNSGARSTASIRGCTPDPRV